MVHEFHNFVDRTFWIKIFCKVWMIPDDAGIFFFISRYCEGNPGNLGDSELFWEIETTKKIEWT